MPGEIDSDRLWAIFTPAGRLRRLQRSRVLSNRTSHLHPDTPNTKGPRKGTLLYLARPERFELPTARFVAEYSIQLSYGRIVYLFAAKAAPTYILAEREGFEPSKGYKPLLP